MPRNWFPKVRHHTGWKESQSASMRRRNLMRTTDKRLSMHNRRLQAGRRIQAIANVTKDRGTKRKARSDANYFFRRL